jgi:hypothetical protein
LRQLSLFFATILAAFYILIADAKAFFIQREGRRQMPCDNMPNLFRLPEQTAVMTNSLYHSLQGQYFVGYADNMFFEPGKGAWAGLFNPYDSDVNLYVNVWTVTDLSDQPIKMQIWMNAIMPGNPIESDWVTPSNLAMIPTPKPIIRILQASNVTETPSGGVKAFVRRAVPNKTIVAQEDGKFIIPPGGNFSIFVANSDDSKQSTGTAKVRLAYGWWEEKLD